LKLAAEVKIIKDKAPHGLVENDLLTLASAITIADKVSAQCVFFLSYSHILQCYSALKWSFYCLEFSKLCCTVAAAVPLTFRNLFVLCLYYHITVGNSP
jgi:hypothetical protein